MAVWRTDNRAKIIQSFFKPRWNIFWFQFLSCGFLLLFFVLCEIKLNFFVFQIVNTTCEDVTSDYSWNYGRLEVHFLFYSYLTESDQFECSEYWSVNEEKTLKPAGWRGQNTVKIVCFSSLKCDKSLLIFCSSSVDLFSRYLMYFEALNVFLHTVSIMNPIKTVAVTLRVVQGPQVKWLPRVVTSSIRSSGPRPFRVSRDSMTSTLFPTHRPITASIQLSTAPVRMPRPLPTLTWNYITIFIFIIFIISISSMYNMLNIFCLTVSKQVYK